MFQFRVVYLVELTLFHDQDKNHTRCGSLVAGGGRREGQDCTG